MYEQYFVRCPLSLLINIKYFWWLVFACGSGDWGHVLMSQRAKSIQSGVAICDSTCLFP